MIWHEAAHAGPGDRLESLIADDARAMDRVLPKDLWHAALFEAVGHTVADVLARDGTPGYVVYAQANGVYRRAWPQYLPWLHAEWRAWLDGEGTLQGAVDAGLARQARASTPAS